MSSDRDLASCLDPFEHGREIMKYLLVPEPDYPVTCRYQHSRPFFVAILLEIVNCAIKFNHELL